MPTIFFDSPGNAIDGTASAAPAPAVSFTNSRRFNSGFNTMSPFEGDRTLDDKIRLPDTTPLASDSSAASGFHPHSTSDDMPSAPDIASPSLLSPREVLGLRTSYLAATRAAPAGFFPVTGSPRQDIRFAAPSHPCSQP